MEKLLFVALVGTGLCVLMRAVRPEYVFLIGLATGALLLLLLAGQAIGLLQTVREWADRFGVEEPYRKALLKMIGIAYLAQFGADLCRDHGASAAAEKLELGGRIAILACALPAATALFESGLALLSGIVP